MTVPVTVVVVSEERLLFNNGQLSIAIALFRFIGCEVSKFEEASKPCWLLLFFVGESQLRIIAIFDELLLARVR